MIFKYFLFASSVLLLPHAAQAMEAKVVNNALILSGPVVEGDVKLFQMALASQPAITTVVLRNSKGGHALSGYQIGALIREHGLSTIVSGHCISSCSRMFLGGKERRFSDDFGLENTYVAFHGHYSQSGQLNERSVNQNGLFDWIVKYSDGKADEGLVRRWIAIQSNLGMVAFMHPDAKTGWFGAERTFFCTGAEKRRPLGCPSIAATAQALGIVTDLEIRRSPDQ